MAHQVVFFATASGTYALASWEYRKPGLLRRRGPGSMLTALGVGARHRVLQRQRADYFRNHRTL